MNPHQSYERYQRQTLLKEFGERGQEKLLQSKVLVIGAGGLGCPVLQYLTAAGIGQLGIVDDDVVSLTNLHRQVLYTMSDIGLPKAERAAFYLRQLNPDVKIEAIQTRLTTDNALEIIRAYDIVVDGSDNFPTRYMVNDACVLLGKPLVYAAISRFEGQVAIFNLPAHEEPRGINYRDLFPEPPLEHEVLNCEEAGVLGVLPGIVGSMQANETIKLIAGIGRPLAGNLLSYNALTCRTYEVSLALSSAADDLRPKDENEFRNTDYGWACTSSSALEIEPAAFNNLLEEENISIIDVREPGELPEVDAFSHLRIPLPALKPPFTNLYGDTVVIFCQSGKRSLTAAIMLHQTLGNIKKVYSLKGGIPSWLKYKNAKSNDRKETKEHL